MAKRALAEADKQARRNDILQAARDLFNSGDGSLPTASQIAAATGLAKGTVYLYFKTKEEIFATILSEGWIPVMRAVSVIFDTAGGKRSAKVTGLITSFVAHLENHPELLRLDALAAGVLEKNMEAEALMRYKRNFSSHLVRAGDSIDRALRLPSGRGVQILMRTHALARGLWQSAQHNENDSQLDVAPELNLTPKRFIREVTSALEEYWRGALASG